MLIRVDVSVGSKTVLTAPRSDFRFTREGGLYSDIALCLKSAKGLNRLRGRALLRATRPMG
jgi:hypothetical protein